MLGMENEAHTGFKNRYLVALRQRVRDTSITDSGIPRELGLDAVALGLTAPDLARMHDEALHSLNLSERSASAAGKVAATGTNFLIGVVSPLGETPSGSVAVNGLLKKMLETLALQTTQLAAANEYLNRELTVLWKMENSLIRSENTAQLQLNKTQLVEEELRHLTHRLLSTQEEERAQISRELQEVLGQSLTGINVCLAAMQGSDVADREAFQAKISRTQGLVQKSMGIAHRIAHDLHPVELDDLGLVPTLHSYAKDLSEQTGIIIDLRVFAGIEKWNMDIRTAIYRVTQEALENAAHHAECGLITITISSPGDSISLTIHDNGKGFDLNKFTTGSHHDHFGLLEMRERIHMVGGTFSLDSAPGDGCTVHAEIPNIREKICK